MKFRNPETGEIYEVTYDNCNSSGFCAEIECGECPLEEYIATGLCSIWVNAHPHEAARLMGYEVLEDDTLTLGKAIEKYLKIKEEANMDKPLKDWTLENNAKPENWPNLIHCGNIHDGEGGQNEEG